MNVAQGVSFPNLLVVKVVSAGRWGVDVRVGSVGPQPTSVRTLCDRAMGVCI